MSPSQEWLWEIVTLLCLMCLECSFAIEDFSWFASYTDIQQSRILLFRFELSLGTFPIFSDTSLDKMSPSKLNLITELGSASWARCLFSLRLSQTRQLPKQTGIGIGVTKWYKMASRNDKRQCDLIAGVQHFQAGAKNKGGKKAAWIASLFLSSSSRDDTRQ